MEIVKPIICYNLRDPKGNKLELRYGRLLNDDGSILQGTIAQRWSFVGKRIPMPVRSHTWFQGLSSTEMLEWLRREGWCLESRVVIGTGSATIYKLPDKANEETTSLGGYREAYEKRFKDAIKFIAVNGTDVWAVRVYQYAHDCDVLEARKAVREIISLDNAQENC